MRGHVSHYGCLVAGHCCLGDLGKGSLPFSHFQCVLTSVIWSSLSLGRSGKGFGQEGTSVSVFS